MTAAAKKAASRVAVVCLECGKRFSVRASTLISPICPKCGGADVDVA